METKRSAQRLVVDTNVLIDRAIGLEQIHEALGALERLKPPPVLVVPPTVIHELAYLAQDEEESPETRMYAATALRSMREWGFSPCNLIPVGHGITEIIASEIQRQGLIPQSERNDALIVAEAALLGADILVTSDAHILDADRDRLQHLLSSFDVASPIRVSPWKLAGFYRA